MKCGVYVIVSAKAVVAIVVKLTNKIFDCVIPNGRPRSVDVIVSNGTLVTAPQEPVLVAIFSGPKDRTDQPLSVTGAKPLLSKLADFTLLFPKL